MTIGTKPPSFVLGIDPGLGGALSLYDARPSNPDAPIPPLHATWDMPTHRPNVRSKLALDARALADLVGELAFEHPGLVAVVENVSSRPRQAGAFAFGFSTGIVHGVLAAHGIPTTSTPPTVWKGAMGLFLRPGETKEEGKARARALAAQLFPDMADQFSRVKDDGRAEAMLLAVYHTNRHTSASQRVKR